MNRLVNTKTLIAELDRRIQFHIHNKIDPHNIGNAVITSLRETKEAIAAASDEIPGAVPVMLTPQDLEDLVFGLKRMRLLEWHDKNDGDREKRLEALCKRFQVLLKEDK